MIYNNSLKIEATMSRRRIPPTTRPTHIPNFSAQNLNSSLNPDSEIILPKHVPFPCGAANKSELLNEFIIFIFTLIAASSQFVHLYRSVWWFPDSYTKYTVVTFTMNENIRIKMQI